MILVKSLFLVIVPKPSILDDITGRQYHFAIHHLYVDTYRTVRSESDFVLQDDMEANVMFNQLSKGFI